MIPIKLSNGKTIEVENESSKNLIVVRTDSFKEIDDWCDILTEENLTGAEMEGQTLSNIVDAGVRVYPENGKIRADFLFREKSTEETSCECISDLEDMVNILLKNSGLVGKKSEDGEKISAYIEKQNKKGKMKDKK